MRMLLKGFDRFADVSHVPELHFAVVAAAGQVVLLVGVEVQVTYQLPVSVLNAVDLTVNDKAIRSNPPINANEKTDHTQR